MIYFEIQADDTARAKHFYTEIFGWEIIRAEEIPKEYYRIQTAEGRGGLLSRPMPGPTGPSGTNAFVCSFEVKNFNETAKKIEALGGIAALPKMAIPKTCWQGYFLDTEKNVFGMFEVDSEAQ